MDSEAVLTVLRSMDPGEVRRLWQKLHPKSPEESSRAGEEDVKRLMTDKLELCCPLSHELFDDPVVAADGISYERSWVEKQLKLVPGKSPMTGLPIATEALNPNQSLKSMVLSFKQETVKGILCLVPSLAKDKSDKALALLERGEGFIRPLLPDASASKQLAALLRLKLKVVDTDRIEIAKEALSLLVKVKDQDDDLLREALLAFQEVDVLTLLPSFGGKAIALMHRALLWCDASSREKLQVLTKAYRIDKENGSIRNDVFAVGGKIDAPEMEGLFLELALEEGADIPSEVLSSLTLEPHHLGQPSPKQLLLLADMLGSNDRSADGARVAVFAAKALAASDKARESEDAFVKAFSLDRSNQEAVEGLANAVTSAHKRCDELEQRRQGPRLEIGSLMEWDLSSYDFTDFGKGKSQLSEKFQISSTGITAWLSLYPRGYSEFLEGMAALFLFVDQPATVKCTWQSGSSEVETVEHDFSQELCSDGTPNGWGRPNFMPISEANGSVTLRVLNVQSLRFT